MGHLSHLGKSLVRRLRGFQRRSYGQWLRFGHKRSCIVLRLRLGRQLLGVGWQDFHFQRWFPIQWRRLRYLLERFGRCWQDWQVGFRIPKEGCWQDVRHWCRSRWCWSCSLDFDWFGRRLLRHHLIRGWNFQHGHSRQRHLIYKQNRLEEEVILWRL